MKKRSELRCGPRRPGQAPGPGGDRLYASRCSAPALVEIVNDEGWGPACFLPAPDCPAGRVLEPFAFVVCGGFISFLNSRRGHLAEIRPGSALPLSYGRLLEDAPGNGD